MSSLSPSRRCLRHPPTAVGVRETFRNIPAGSRTWDIPFGVIAYVVIDFVASGFCIVGIGIANFVVHPMSVAYPLVYWVYKARGPQQGGKGSYPESTVPVMRGP